MCSFIILFLYFYNTPQNYVTYLKLGNYTISIFIICFFSLSANGQEIDSLELILPDSNVVIHKDSMGRVPYKGTVDTIPETTTLKDSLNVLSLNERKDSSLVLKRSNLTSNDSLEAVINYGAQDTQWYDHKSQTMHLYGKAYVEYENMKLNAGYIIFDMENNIATAEGLNSLEGEEKQLPTFNDGEREFTYDRLKYNFKKKKGIVYDAITNEGGLFVHGAKTKYVSKAQDSLGNNDIIYNKDALITSCNHPEPHYGIRANKMKVVANKVAVVGPSNLELAGVPTPLWLPFGFFPLTESESSGLIFPNDFRYSPEQGFGIEGLGWYFPINDYMNLILKGNLYTNLSHGITATSNYKKRYRYSGSFTVRYDNDYVENSEAYLESRKRFAIGIRHNQDTKAHPYRKFGGDVNFQFNGFAAAVNNDANSVLNNVYTSNLSFSHSMPRTPFSFTSAFRHSQNTRQETIDVTLPDIQLRMNTIFPFKSKTRPSTDERWYEKISFKYDTEFKNLISSTDSTIFTKVVFDEMRSGISNRFNTGASYRILKHFNFVPSASYNEMWLFQTAQKSIETDEKGIERTVTKFNGSFRSYRDFSTGASLKTNIFASLPATKGWFRGYRHTIKPSLNFNYAPETRSAYEQILLSGQDTIYYSPFERAAVSVPGLHDLRGRVGLTVGGTVEMKYFSKKDSTEKKIKLLDNLNFSSGYDLAKDSLNYDEMSIRGTARLFKGITTFGFGFGFDPYVENENGRVNQFVGTSDRLIPLRMDDGFLKLNSRFKLKQIVDFINKKKSSNSSGDSEVEDPKERGPSSLATWIENLTLEHNIQYNFITTKGERKDELVANTLRLNGRIALTDKWDMNIGNISYDFKNKSWVYPSFSLSRNLHCWRMSFSWAPFREQYSFFIGVTNSNLEFLKYNYGQSNVDGLLRAGF